MYFPSLFSDSLKVSRVCSPLCFPSVCGRTDPLGTVLNADSDLEGLGQDLSFCISNELLGDASAVVWGPPFQQQDSKVLLCVALQLPEFSSL